MLPARARLRASEDFRRTIRHGVRAGRSTLVVHVHATDDPPAATRVGFVVSKAVGGAVVRNRVKRRLRHLTRPLVAAHPQGLTAVVRALPPAAAARAELADDLRGAWSSCLGKLGLT